MPTKPRKELYREASREVKANSGTPYSISQPELDTLRAFSHRNSGPFTTQTRATQELISYNLPNRTPPSAEHAAIQRLRSAVQEPESWSPDIIIKAFHDLDTVFFNGRLRNNVTFAWKTAVGLHSLHPTLTFLFRCDQGERAGSAK